jgi:KUP system potassium uptake protein
MSTDSVDEHRAASRVDQPTTAATALTAMGIVYGDLGTSPLYTLQAVAQTFDGHLSASAALGSLSLIFWLLIITISIKYCLFVMRADNHGEGGILALMSLAPSRSEQRVGRRSSFGRAPVPVVAARPRGKHRFLSCPIAIADH